MSTAPVPTRFAISPPGGLSDRHRVTFVWAALFFNVLAFIEMPTVIPIPGSVGQLLTQGALVLALVLAIRLNPQITIRPNLFLLLFSLIAVVAVMTGPHNEFWAGSTYRAVRYAAFLLVLWLLTPFWGRDERFLLRAHMAVLQAVIASVLAGLALSPGGALASGRLSGVLWPIPATQVAHYAAVLLGLLIIQRLLFVPQTRWAVVWGLACGGVLVGTHTRTAVFGLLAGLAAAVGSLFLGYARVRRVSAMALAGALVAAAVFGPLIGTWLLRGQSASEVSSVTGRTLVWEQVLSTPRGHLETMFGSGMSNTSFNGLPIDSNWVATFYDLGMLGVTLEILAILVLLVTAAVRPSGHARAVALFLIVYCVVASFTETGLNAPSGYLLDLVVAASLLALPIGEHRPGHREIVPPARPPKENPVSSGSGVVRRRKARVRIAA